MKINWGFGILITYLLFVAGMVVLAVKSTNQNLDLVSDNYYEAAVSYQNKIMAINNAMKDTSQLTINIIGNGKYVEIENSQDKHIGFKGNLTFYKPDKAKDDFTFDFEIDSSGRKIIPLKKMTHGYWKLIATWKINENNFYKEEKVFIQ
jgi:hypothetical protein